MERIRGFFRTIISRRRIIALCLLAFVALFHIYDLLATRRFYPQLLFAIPKYLGLALLLPDLIRVRPPRKMLGWCLLIAAALAVRFNMYAMLIFTVPSILLCALICFQPKLKWPIWVMWGLYVIAHITVLFYLYGSLMLLWMCLIGVTSISSVHPLNFIGSILLNILLAITILGTYLTIKGRKQQQEAADDK
jgi:hypothetical protein